MTDRIRAFLNRPLGEGDRRLLFSIAVGTILLATAAFALIDDPGTERRDTGRPEHARSTFSPTTIDRGAAAALDLPSEEGPAEPQEAAGTHADVAEAKRAARRFLAGYLPFTYGQRTARRIPAATGRLRRRLAVDRPRVPPRERRRQPRVVLLQAEGVGPVRAGLVALVDDGARRYTVPLQLTQQRHGWVVTAVGE